MSAGVSSSTSSRHALGIPKTLNPRGAQSAAGMHFMGSLVWQGTAPAEGVAQLTASMLA